MKTIKGYKFRIYPNKTQIEQINTNLGCSRFVYNYFLGRNIEEYKETGKSNIDENLLKRELTQLKKLDEYKWLNDADSQALQHSIKHLTNAFKNFFKRIKKGNPKAGFPKFKKKGFNRSYSTNNTMIKIIDESHIHLPKLGSVKAKIHRPIEGHIMSVIISKSRSGKYYISFNCRDVEIKDLAKTEKSVGIDLGIKSFLYTSDGDNFNLLERFKKLEEKLAREQRKLSRKQHKWYKAEDGHFKPSNNYEKQRIKLAKVYEKITNKKKDLLHKISKYLIENYDIICIEDLAISNMLKNHKLAKCIQDSNFHMFKTMLDYKSYWYGKILSIIDRYYPSSKLCHVCGYKNIDLKLKDREWICPECNAHHDRDLNASINILNEGLRILNLA